MRHKNRAKYIENYHLCKEQAEKQSKKKIENEQKEGNIDERRAKKIKQLFLNARAIEKQLLYLL